MPESRKPTPDAVETEPTEVEPTEVEPTEVEATEPEATEVESTAAEPAASKSMGSESKESDVAEPETAEPETAEPETAPTTESEVDEIDEVEIAKPETDAAEPDVAEPAAELETDADEPEPAVAQRTEPETADSESGRTDPTKAPDGLRKLVQIVRKPPGRGQILVAVLLAVLAFGAVVQGRTVSGSGDYAGARRGDLIQLLDSLDAARDRAESQLRELQNTKLELENDSTSTQAALREAREEASTLAILSGTVGATGPGIVIRIDDPADQVGASTLLNVVEELRDAGAEAIEINDSARVIAQTYLADSTDGVSVDGTVVSSPFIIDVIGHPHTLGEAVEFPGGVTEIVESLGGTVDVDERDTVDVTSLAVRREPEYSQPAD
ncbi:MAG: DUF881 domain-containing protein [Nocardioidaceae bacterium]